MLAAYGSAAIACYAAANACSAHPRYRSGGPRIRTMRRERMLWTGMAGFLAILAIYRQFDLADLVTGWGRTIAVDGMWYGQRRPLQGDVLAVGIIAVVLGAALVMRSVAAVTPLAIIALAACTALLLLLGTNVLSLHGTDALLRMGYHRVTVYNLVEAGSLATILASARLYRHEAMAVMRR